MYQIRRFEEKDANEVREMIKKTMFTCNIKDEPAEHVEGYINGLTPQKIIERAGWMHLYVVCDHEKIIGSGAIGPYWGKEDESSLFMIFVLPEYQGKGIGRRIVETMEEDEFFLRAKRIEIPASITGCNFYRKLGYTYKNGVDHPDEQCLYRLEKVREV